MALNRLCTANIDNEEGSIRYTQILNTNGQIEADITVCKIHAEKYLIIATDTAHRHVETLLHRELNPQNDRHVCVVDVTSQYAILSLQGPLSRLLLQKLTDTDMSNEKFPYRAARDIDLGFANVYCIRITYVGKLLFVCDIFV